MNENRTGKNGRNKSQRAVLIISDQFAGNVNILVN